MRNISNKTIVMNKGKIVEMNNTKKVFESPESEYTKELIDQFQQLQMPRRNQTMKSIEKSVAEILLKNEDENKIINKLYH